jgi:hypothetical protein
VGFFDRFREPWSLDGVRRPWSGTSLYQFLLAHIDATTGRLAAEGERLPDDKDEGNAIRWAPGALDGVATHHMGAGEETLRVKQIVNALQDLVTRAGEDGLSHLFSLVTREAVLGVMDEVVEQVRKNPRLRAERVHAVGLLLATEAPARDAVKFGAALLGTVQGPDDSELLTTLGLHDEFTLFAAVAIANQSDDAELALWDLAKRVDGWGRIHLVERLAEARRPEIRAWLIRDGFRNSVMDEYLAYTCAMAGHLHTALAAPVADLDLLRGASGIFVALARGGPAQDLADYEHASKAIAAWLDHIANVPRDLEQLEALDALCAREEVAPLLKARIDRLRDDPTVVRVIQAGLASTDRTTFGFADQAARRRSIETFSTHESLLQRGVGDANYSLFRLMQEATESTIDRALATAGQQVDVERIATGPGDNLGIGRDFAAHGLLDFILQELGRFPSRGAKFILAGLRSPVIRNRNGALRALAAWGRERWPADVAAAVASAAGAEPVNDVRARFARVLAGEPFDDPPLEADGPSAENQ